MELTNEIAEAIADRLLAPRLVAFEHICFNGDPIPSMEGLKLICFCRAKMAECEQLRLALEGKEKALETTKAKIASLRSTLEAVHAILRGIIESKAP